VQSETLLGAAVANNALWCDAVCRSHGYPGVFSSRLWLSMDHGLELYPHAITLSPDTAASETVMIRDRSRPYAVKDSFARLDLTPDGLEVLFEAEWIVRIAASAEPPDNGLSWDTVHDVHELGLWEMVWTRRVSRGGPLFRPGLLADPRCAILACHRDGELIAGAITYTAGEVAGISNLFSTALPAGQLWTSALQAVAALRPHVPIVGYEHGTGLTSARQAGCQSLGPLRVWARLTPPRAVTAPRTVILNLMT
jgi:hypothetical protein